MTISRNLSFLAEGVSSTGVLGATYGGTGQSSITTGDLLYGSASNTISKLAIGSTGTVLRVVGGVPSWGTDYTGTVTSVAATVPSFLSISGSPITSSGTLAITYSGTALPIANGGTAQTSFTAGQVLYGSFSQSGNLFWDATNNVLGAGTNAPNTYTGNKIVAYGGGIAATSGSGTTSGSFQVFSNGQTNNQITLSQGFGGTDNIGYLYNRANADFVFGTNNTERMRIAAGGNIGVGVSPASSASFPLFIGKDQSAGTFLGVSNYQNNAAAQAGIDIEAYGGLWRMYTPQSSTNSNPLIFSWLGTTEYMRISASGGVSIGNTTDPGAGNLRFTTTGTNGIYFGSTSRLDTYETGTWTPTGNGISFAAGTSGKYTKIGNLVTLTFNVVFPTTANTSNAYITAMPFTLGNNSAAAIGNFTNGINLIGTTGNTYMLFLNTTGTAFIPNSTLSGQTIVGSISYQV